jgi:hypothetical protein
MTSAIAPGKTTTSKLVLLVTTFRGRCPVVFLANQDKSANRWVDAVVAERIVGDDPRDPAIPGSRHSSNRSRAATRSRRGRCASHRSQASPEYGHRGQSVIAAARSVAAFSPSNLAHTPLGSLLWSASSESNNPGSSGNPGNDSCSFTGYVLWARKLSARSTSQK